MLIETLAQFHGASQLLLFLFLLLLLGIVDGLLTALLGSEGLVHFRGEVFALLFESLDVPVSLFELVLPLGQLSLNVFSLVKFFLAFVEGQESLVVLRPQLEAVLLQSRVDSLVFFEFLTHLEAVPARGLLVFKLCLDQLVLRASHDHFKLLFVRVEAPLGPIHQGKLEASIYC